MKNFLLLHLLLIVCVNTISSYSALDKRDVHRIILRSSHRPKRHRSPNYQQEKHRHRHHRHKNHEHDEELEEDNESFVYSSESSLEKPAKYKNHYTQNPITSYPSYFPNVENPRNKRQKHNWKPSFNMNSNFDYVHDSSLTIPHTFQPIHKEYLQTEKTPNFSTFKPLSGQMENYVQKKKRPNFSTFEPLSGEMEDHVQKEKRPNFSTLKPLSGETEDYLQTEKRPNFSTFKPLSGTMDEFSDFKFYQNFLNLHSLPSSNVASFVEPNKGAETFILNNTYKVYEEEPSTDVEVKHNALRSSSASRFINRQNKVFDDTDNAQEDRTKAMSDKQKQNAAIRQRSKKMRGQLI